MRGVVLPVFALLVCISPASAARSIPANQPISVKLETSQPTAIALPEPVASVSVGMAPERFSLDYDGPYLFLLPLDPTISGRLFIVGQSGTLYTLLFKVASPADDVVHVTAATAPSHAQAQPFSVASVLRAMRAGTTVPGQQPIDLPPPAFTDARISLTSSSAFAVGGTLGLVLTLKNLQPTPLALDLRIGEPVSGAGEQVVALAGWTCPPRLTIKAVAADGETLASDAETRVYVILEKRP
jgi:hypothetical protein